MANNTLTNQQAVVEEAMRRLDAAIEQRHAAMSAFGLAVAQQVLDEQNAEPALRIAPYVTAEVPTDEQVTQALLDDYWSRETRRISESKAVYAS